MSIAFPRLSPSVVSVGLCVLHCGAVQVAGAVEVELPPAFQETNSDVPRGPLPLAGLPRRVPANDEDNGEDSPVKYLAMFQRRAEKGQCFAQPSFGCREFPAHFELADESAMRVAPGLNPDTDLGLMLYDVFNLDVAKDQPPGKVEKPALRITFFPARLQDGVVNVPDWNEMKNQLGGAQ